MTPSKVHHGWKVAPNVGFFSEISRGPGTGVGGEDEVKAAVMVEAGGQSGERADEQ
ncbi:hypothetical protein ACFVSU_01815 [Microbacterium sp. NPDC058062]|uniref:hypothetical protein n=1 Tax=Microbacterium sp. NPDC058062 TaxID=3346320 RepID=UPI0036D7FFDF